MAEKTNPGFGDLEAPFRSFETSQTVLLPIPFDKTSSYGKGADAGPQALLEASRYVELWDIETQSEPYRSGIFTDAPILGDSPEELTSKSHKRVGELLKKRKFIISLGGEHSVSVGPIKAFSEHFQKLTVLQLDAHTDLRESYLGSRLNHACVMARAQEMVDRVVAVGIRSLDSTELGRVKADNVFYAERIVGQKGWVKEVVSRLGQQVYITLDLDVFDPSIMPSTGTPEPGGLGWYEVLAFLRTVFEQREVVGCDVVELAPTPANSAPDFLAAKLVYKMITYKHGLKRTNEH